MKASATDVLLTAIQTVMAGGCWVGLKRVTNLMQYLQSQMQAAKNEARTKTYGLTRRKLEIVSGVVAAMGNKEIAGYFKRYKLWEPDKFSEVPGWGTSAEGLALVQVTHAFFLECRQVTASTCRVAP